MHRSISAGVAAALAVCLVPQAAFGISKPPATAHPDTAPVGAAVDPRPAVKSRPGGAGLSVSASSVVFGGGGGSTESNSMSFTALTTGDIIVVSDPTSLTGHAGLFDRSRYVSIQSSAVLSANVTPVSGVQVEKCAKYRLYDRAWGLRVPREYAHRVGVRDFAARQLGKPYSVAASKTDLTSFYCSKLAWAAYRFVTGIDLDADGGLWVWPVDLLNSTYTSVVGYWS